MTAGCEETPGGDRVTGGPGRRLHARNARPGDPRRRRAARHYIENEALRLGILRELDEAVDAQAHARILASLQDRFGRLPGPARNLLDMFLVKHQLGSQGMSGARFVPPDRLVLTHDAGRGPQGSWLQPFDDVRPIDAAKTHVIVPESARQPELLLELLRAALLGEDVGSKLRSRSSRRGGRKRSRSRRKPGGGR
jgi:hypothetical protein